MMQTMCRLLFGHCKVDDSLLMATWCVIMEKKRLCALKINQLNNTHAFNVSNMSNITAEWPQLCFFLIWESDRAAAVITCRPRDWLALSSMWP